MQRLEARIAVMEARHAPVAGVVALADNACLSASIQALLVAVRPDGIDRLHDLLERMDADATTPAERAMLASLPPCSYSPHELVRLMVRVNDSF